MRTVAVSQIKPGDRLAEDVLTPLGSVLFRRGQMLTAREIEILEAFLVSSVQVQEEGDEAAASASDVDVEAELVASPFEEAFERLTRTLKKAFDAARCGEPIPVWELRHNLEKLLDHIGDYHPLAVAGSNRKKNEDDRLRSSVEVALTSYQIAAHLADIPEKERVQIALAGLLRDIGNARLSPHILDKPDRLTSEEMEEIKKHPVLGYQLLQPVAALNRGVKLCALQHHEREDGSGYPMGVTKERIHPYAKIVAVADMFHAMTSDRKYRKAASPYLVIEELYRQSFGKLDPKIVLTFLHHVTELQVGTTVQLSDGRVGDIVFADRREPTRPIVNVGGVFVNLAAERHLHIVKVISRPIPS